MIVPFLSSLLVACGQRGVHSGGYCDETLTDDYNVVVASFNSAVQGGASLQDLTQIRAHAASVKSKYKDVTCTARRPESYDDLEVDVGYEMDTMISQINSVLEN